MTESTGIGAALKQAREAQGLAIDDVALQLKFAPRQIESLEQERFDRLPGPTIAPINAPLLGSMCAVAKLVSPAT